MTPLDLVERMLRGTDAWEAFQELVRGERGGANNPSGVNQHSEVNRDPIPVDLREPVTLPLRRRDYSREAPTGTSVSYALRRLGRERPDLYERVKAGRGDVPPGRRE